MIFDQQDCVIIQNYSNNTHHEDVICVWNLASSSEEFTKVVELERKFKERKDAFITI